jgi:hypothetical protein
VALHAAADHRAVEHAERGEQGGGAVPLVIVRHGLAAARLDRQSGLGAVERLDLALFVEREHHGVSWRIDIEPDDVSELGGKAGIARALEGAQPMRLQFVRPARCAAPNPARCRSLWPSPGWSSGSPGAAVRCRSMPPLAPWSPLRSAPCRACGSCRAADRQPRSRQSAAAIATWLVG